MTTPATDAVISVDGLVKTFGSFRAVDGLDLKVTRGEVHGFLGPNGCLLYTSPSPRDRTRSRMPSSA